MILRKLGEHMKRTWLGIGIVAIVAIVALLVFMPREPMTLKVGYVGPLTTELANVGKPNLQGIQLAVEKINEEGGIGGKKVELLIHDDQNSERTALSAYQQLQSQGVKLIFSTNYAPSIAMAERALKDGILVVDTLDTSEELAALDDGLAAIGVYDEGIGYAIADDLNAKGYKSISILYNNANEFSSLIVDSIQERLTKKPLVIPYNGIKQDYRSELLKAGKPDALVIIGWDETGMLLKQARELGIDAQLYTIDTLLSENVLNAAGNAAYGVKFTFWTYRNDSVTRAFKARYAKRFGGEPDNPLFTTVGYDAAIFTLETLKQKPQNTTLIEALKQAAPFQGVTGTIKMDPDGAVRSIREHIYLYTPDGPKE